MDFLNWFHQRSKNSSHIIGDFNINYFLNSVSKIRLCNWLSDCNFTNLVKEPTREVTYSNGKTTSTSIDWCISRSSNKADVSIIDTGISDHYAIILKLGRKKSIKKKIKIKKTRFTDEVLSYARFRMPQFKDDDSVDHQANVFTTWLMEISERATTMKSCTVSEHTVHNDWYNEKLRLLKDRVTASVGGDRKRLRNKYVSELRKAKRSFLSQKINENIEKGGVWKILNKKSKIDKWELNLNDKTSTDETEIAEAFKDFFSTKATSLAKTPTPKEIFAKMDNYFSDVEPWDLTPCSPEDVIKEIEKLKGTLSAGPDGISNALLKFLKLEIVGPLTSIINKSMFSGCFPSVWKTGKICPVPKKGPGSSLKNYRPICLSSNIGKVVEAVVRSRVTTFIDNLLPTNMYGFRKNRSTCDALTSILDTVRGHRANGKKVAILALDASAAFDTLDHRLIIESLKRMGAGPLMLAWSEDFLSGCEYFVQIGSARSSSWSSGKTGVGQGKKFSPDYFNIGTVSQTFWCNFVESAYFADDGGDVVVGDTAEECQARIQEAADRKAEWFHNAGLTLNVSKSEVIGFGFSPSPITLNGEIILPSTSIKFLGLTIQSNLKWDQHVAGLCNKIRWSAGRIRSEGHLFGVNEKRVLFNGWIMGAIQSNALAFLPSLSEGLLSSLQTAMNAGIRAVLNLPRKSIISMSAQREKHGFQSITDIRDKSLMIAALKKKDHFIHLSNSESRPNTRAKSNGDIPHPNLKGHFGKTVSAATATMWNKIPKNIRDEPYFKKASRMVKQLFKKTKH